MLLPYSFNVGDWNFFLEFEDTCFKKMKRKKAPFFYRAQCLHYQVGHKASAYKVLATEGREKRTGNGQRALREDPGGQKKVTFFLNVRLKRAS